MTQDCSTCIYHAMIDKCKPLNDIHRRLMTRIHGTSFCYYSHAIEKFEEITKIEPCIYHSDLNQ